MSDCVISYYSSWMCSNYFDFDLWIRLRCIRTQLTSRNLADVHNRGKLNLPEFHVAMGLIYRGELVAVPRTPPGMADTKV